MSAPNDVQPTPIPRTYIYGLGDLQPGPLYRIPIVGMPAPMPLGLIVTCLGFGLLLVGLALGALR